MKVHPAPGGGLLLLGVHVLGLLAALLAGFADHSGQTAGVTAGSNRRAAVDPGRAHGLDRTRLVGPGVGLLAGPARAELLRNPVAVGFRAPGADHHLVIRGTGAGI